MPRKYLFIDGGFFRGFVDEMKEAVKAELGEVDIDLRFVGGGFDRVLFYDAYPEQKDNQTAEEFESERSETQRYFEKIAQTRDFNVRPALTRRGQRREQKGVDVLLAIECLLHAVRNNIDEAAIMTSDLDFFPLFEALLQTKTKSVLRYQIGRTSNELIQAADYAEPLTAIDFIAWLPVENRVKLVWTNLAAGEESELRTVADGIIAGKEFELQKSNVSGAYFASIDGHIQGSGHNYRFLVEGQIEKVMKAPIQYNDKATESN